MLLFGPFFHFALNDHFIIWMVHFSMEYPMDNLYWMLPIFNMKKSKYSLDRFTCWTVQTGHGIVLYTNNIVFAGISPNTWKYLWILRKWASKSYNSITSKCMIMIIIISWMVLNLSILWFIGMVSVRYHLGHFQVYYTDSLCGISSCCL